MSAFFRQLTLMVSWIACGGAGAAFAELRPLYDVLCDATVAVYSCHPPHPYGRVLDFADLERTLNNFPAATMSATLVSGETLTSRRFKVIENAIIIGRDTLRPKEFNSFALRTTWPQWRTVADLAVGGALMFGGIGLIIDGLQWVGGSGGDLGATGTGALVGAGLFGGLGILFAREHYHVLIQEGWEQRVVEGAPSQNLAPPALAGAR